VVALGIAASGQPMLAAWEAGRDRWTLADVPTGAAGPLLWTGHEVLLAGERPLAWEPEAGSWSVLPGDGDAPARSQPAVTWSDPWLVLWGGVGDDGIPRTDGRIVTWGVPG
jgi:hypothetical protein